MDVSEMGLYFERSDAIPPLKAGVTVAHFHACGTCPTDINEVKIAESP